MDELHYSKPPAAIASRVSKPELMAPAGNKTMLFAVINSGADAVYLGVEKLNMRAKASNFKSADLPEMILYCKEKGVKTYLTLNTIIYENELDQLRTIIAEAKDAGVDRIICWDFSVVQLCKEIGMPFCISTQGSVSNSLAAKFYKDLGAERIVLARECSLEDIKRIRALTNLEIEVFVHGAMCIALSGRCFMSHYLFDKSANKGECIQPCRREYEVYDPIINKGMVIGEDYVLSPQDLCTIEFIDKLIETGVDSFKIEGRKRSPEYAAAATTAYRKAIDLYFEGELTPDVKKELITELEKVFNRGFSSGFYIKTPGINEYADSYGSIASKRKEYLGKVINYYKKAGIAYISIESGTLNTGDEIYIIGDTTGVIKLKVENIMNEEDELTSASKGDRVTFRCNDLVRARDAVYLIKNQEETRTL
ncbi:MAG TPA: U32 family peptidase [Ignavibacteriaceae bacterium]|nr:U32 family peptidase [Ignavibacteriaceae bacterium]